MCRLTRTREQQCTSEIWICSRQRSSSRILRQSCLQQNSAKIIGVGMRGLKVKSRILSNMAKTHTDSLQHGQPRVYCCSWSTSSATSSGSTRSPGESPSSGSARGDRLRDLPKWLEDFSEQWWTQKPSSSGSGAVGLPKPRCPVSLPKGGSGKHDVLTHSPKNPNCEVCRLHADSAQSPTSPWQRNLVTLLRADHKILNEEGESRLSGTCTTFGHSADSKLPVQNNNSLPKKRREAHRSFSMRM